jgi:hypothetical protein
MPDAIHPPRHDLGEHDGDVGWKVAAKRDFKDFYVAVLATPHGNLAEYIVAFQGSWKRPWH